MAKKEAIPAAPMRVLKVNSCPSLSGRSTLTYHIGCNANGDILLQVAASSGSGSFNSDAIPLSLIETLLSEHPASKPLTSGSIRSVFRHRSSNSHGYLWAIMKSESLILPAETNDGGYTVGNVESFKQAMSALIASDTNLDTDVTANPEATKRKRGKPA
jgi:hypothetical protein